MITIRTSATRERFSRRALLRRLGASAALLPLVNAERALGAGAPKRLITVAWANGVAQPSFYPAGDDPTEGAIMQPLAALKAKVTLVAGLDIKVMLDGGHTYDGHFAFPSLFTGTYKNMGGQNSAATGPSIDQVVSDAVAKQVNLPVPLLNVTVAGKSASFRADGTRNTGETDPTRLFNTLFASKTASPDQLNALRARRKSVIDYVSGELSSFGTRLGTDDKAKIAGHLDSIRKLELELAATPSSAACMVAMPGVAADYQAKMKVFNDLVATAIRCDISRAVSLTWADDGGSGPGALPFLNLTSVTIKPADGASEIHAIAHQGAAGYDQKIKIDTWYLSQLAYLAKALADTPEVGGTALDNSLIVMGNDMAEGSFHSVNAIPFVLVGTAGGAIKAGRTVKVGSWATKTGTYWKSGNSGVAHNRLLASIANAMDIPGETFGSANYGGTLAELKG
jgi:hypothetical protein